MRPSILNVSLPPEHAVMHTICRLFDVTPDHWGLRGDPYLWADMARVFQKVPCPESAECLQAMLEGAFVALTAQTIHESSPILVQRYAHGGISSGCISQEFWRTVAIPLLLKRFKDGL